MYSQIIYFVIALSLFGLQQPARQPVLPLWATLLTALCLLGAFGLVCRLLYGRLTQLVRTVGLAQEAIGRYHSLHSLLSLSALLIFALQVYVLNIKSHLIRIPILGESLTATGLAALAIFGMHLTVMWSQSYEAHRIINHSRLTREAYLKTQVTFSLGILAPWLCISLAIDLLVALGIGDVLDSAWGQMGFLGTFMLMFMLFGPWLVVRLWRCEPLTDPHSRAEMEAFCREHSFPVGAFYEWPVMGGESLTAGIVGIIPRLRYILITRGLLSILNPEELRAVMAHEMGHVRRLHLPFFLFLFLGYFLLAYAVNDVLAVWLLRHSAVFSWATSQDTTDQILFSLVYTLPFLLMLVIYFRFIFGYFLRNSERQADLFAMELQGHPFALATSLQKIAIATGNTEDVPSWHHYSIRERVNFLLDAFHDKTLSRSHNRKLYAAACFFFLVALGSSYALHRFQQTPSFNNWQKTVHLHLLKKALEPGSDEPMLYGAYAGLLLEQERYEEAELILKKALSIDPEHPASLNNLAWLYATAPGTFFDPKKALELAERAAGLESAPYILDTLAEAYYVNGQFDAALETIARALDQKPDNRDYYLQQKRKFQEALEESLRPGIRERADP